MSAIIDELTFFDRVALCNSAVLRAKQYAASDEQRFMREYQTARMWHSYRCVITPTIKYIERY